MCHLEDDELAVLLPFGAFGTQPFGDCWRLSWGVVCTHAAVACVAVGCVCVRTCVRACVRTLTPCGLVGLIVCLSTCLCWAEVNVPSTHPYTRTHAQTQSQKKTDTRSHTDAHPAKAYPPEVRRVFTHLVAVPATGSSRTHRRTTIGHQKQEQEQAQQ